MRFNGNFILKKLGEENIVVPIGQEAVNLNAVLSLNETGVIIYEALQKGSIVSEVASILIKEYDVTQKKAMEDIEKFIEQLKSLGIIYE